MRFTTWNRRVGHLKRDVSHNGYRVIYVHGHTVAPMKENCFSLDTLLGKSSAFSRAESRVLFAKGISNVSKSSKPKGLREHADNPDSDFPSKLFKETSQKI